MSKTPAKPQDERPRAEAAQMTRRVMKAMLEMAPEEHDAVQRRVKRERKKAKAVAKREGKR
jgi:hypothetical protein